MDHELSIASLYVAVPYELQEYIVCFFDIHTYATLSQVSALYRERFKVSPTLSRISTWYRSRFTVSRFVISDVGIIASQLFSAPMTQFNLDAVIGMNIGMNSDFDGDVINIANLALRNADVFPAVNKRRKYKRHRLRRRCGLSYKNGH